MGEVCKSMNGLGNVNKEKFVMICHKTGTRGPEIMLLVKNYTKVVVLFQGMFLPLEHTAIGGCRG